MQTGRPNVTGNKKLGEELAPLPSVSKEELQVAVNQIEARKTAFGSGGVYGKALALASNYLITSIRHIFDQCLKHGKFLIL